MSQRGPSRVTRRRQLLVGDLTLQVSERALLLAPRAAAAQASPNGTKLFTELVPGIVAAAGGGSGHPPGARTKNGPGLGATLRGGQQRRSRANGDPERETGAEDGDPFPIGLLDAGLRSTTTGCPIRLVMWASGGTGAAGTARSPGGAGIGHGGLLWRSVVVWNLRRTMIIRGANRDIPRGRRAASGACGRLTVSNTPT